MNKSNKKGFTLAELLIVVAIIAVLVAIAIPVFTSQLEKAREATDAANLRAAYAEIMAEAVLSDNTTATEKEVKQTQTKADWQTANLELPKNLDMTGAAPVDATSGAKTWKLTYDAANSKVVVAFKA